MVLAMDVAMLLRNAPPVMGEMFIGGMRLNRYQASRHARNRARRTWLTPLLSRAYEIRRANFYQEFWGRDCRCFPVGKGRDFAVFQISAAVTDRTLQFVLPRRRLRRFEFPDVVLLRRNHAVEFLGSAAASAAVRCASRRTRRRGKALNGESFLSVSVSREGASHCARGGRAPHSNCLVPA